MEEKFTYQEISEDDIFEWCSGSLFLSSQEMMMIYLQNILTGQYDLEEARMDVLSFKKNK